MVNEMEEGRKRVLGIMASILVSRHLRTAEDLHGSRPSPRTESLVGSAVQWAERIMRRIDGTFARRSGAIAMHDAVRSFTSSGQNPIFVRAAMKAHRRSSARTQGLSCSARSC
jgi:hypothetical protein